MFEVSDERLAADLKKSSGNTPAHHPVGELLDRHWEAVFAYARLCTNGVRPAGMLTTAAFTRLFGESLRQTGPTAAWRPQLLVTVRRMTAEWLGDQRREMLHPELLADSDSRDRVMARLLPPENRRQLSRAFQRLPELARCLLWHTEVEAEQLAVPAGLLGIGDDDALVELRRARERLREGCLEIHRELAPEEECRRFHRMLDVSLRRGGLDLDADLSRHMGRCRHCRHTADQLSRFNGDLALALAEALLGWGAAAYLDSRPGRVDAIVEVTEVPDSVPAAHRIPPLPSHAPLVPGEPPRPAPRSRASGDSRPPTHKAPRRSSRRAPRRNNIALAALTVSGMILVPLILWVTQSSDGAPGIAGGAGPSGSPSSGPVKAPGSNPSWIGTGDTSKGGVRGRLRNTETGLCIGIVGKKPAKGVETALTPCSSAASQEWSYEDDGLLRDLAAPDLCLDSHLGYSVQLAPCTGASQPGTKNVRYDFTLQGMVVPRWNQDLVLTPASTKGEASVVLKVRGRSPTSTGRWTPRRPHSRWRRSTGTPPGRRRHRRVRPLPSRRSHRRRPCPSRRPGPRPSPRRPRPRLPPTAAPRTTTARLRADSTAIPGTATAATTATAVMGTAVTGDTAVTDTAAARAAIADPFWTSHRPRPGHARPAAVVCVVVVGVGVVRNSPWPTARPPYPGTPTSRRGATVPG
ncbi:ricin-type beta-trefoil lectin domain protein [Streptomyces sp. Ag82_O1-15]|uniref:ricin-type beta-trefoil lectin domain protein n=1 Tax=Streptomyces sp. Ag82_O1-15 TaxID=1938855 RepID=UPI0027B8F4B8|nr:ricin-type beta-trefoil lectin domain protein [Streptomyces sp. Ag82_O1-15]